MFGGKPEIPWGGANGIAPAGEPAGGPEPEGVGGGKGMLAGLKPGLKYISKCGILIKGQWRTHGKPCGGGGNLYCWLAKSKLDAD